MNKLMESCSLKKRLSFPTTSSHWLQSTDLVRNPATPSFAFNLELLGRPLLATPVRVSASQMGCLGAGMRSQVQTINEDRRVFYVVLAWLFVGTVSL